MIGALKILTKRPSDRHIMIGRIVFGLILSLSAYYSLIYSGREIETELLFGLVNLSETGIICVKYTIVGLGLIPIIMGAANICLLKSKYMRYIQVFFAIMLFYISGIIVETPELGVDTLIGFMGIFPLFAGITGKCITTKCLRFGEKVTKIRV